MALQEARKRRRLLPEPDPQAPGSERKRIQVVDPGGSLLHRAGRHLHVRRRHRRLLCLPQHWLVSSLPSLSFNVRIFFYLFFLMFTFFLKVV